MKLPKTRNFRAQSILHDMRAWKISRRRCPRESILMRGAYFNYQYSYPALGEFAIMVGIGLAIVGIVIVLEYCF